MEMADDGDLFEKIKKKQKKSGHLEEKEIWNIFIEIVFGLKALHERNIFHRDLKVCFIYKVIKIDFRRLTFFCSKMGLQSWEILMFLR